MRRTEKATGGCMLLAGSGMKRRRSLLFGTNHGGVEMMIRLEAWVYTGKKELRENVVKVRRCDRVMTLD